VERLEEANILLGAAEKFENIATTIRMADVSSLPKASLPCAV